MNVLRHVLIGALTALVSAVVERFAKEQPPKAHEAGNDPPAPPVFDGPTQFFRDEDDKGE